MSKYQEYVDYQESNLDWLGKVPKSWGLKRLGQYFTERREKVSDVDYPPLSVDTFKS
jgi:type I restriction enzyme S subunit